MYLWTILQKSEEELVTKVYQAQKLFPVKDDFIYQIKEDMEDLGLELEDDKIKNMKKAEFKNLVNSKIREAAHSYLLQKKDMLSKLKNLSSDYQLKEYLQTDCLSTSEKQLLFKLRTRMIPVVKNPTTISIQLNTTSTAVGFDTIMTVHTPTPPHPGTLPQLQPACRAV